MPETNALIKFNIGKARILLSTIEMGEHRSVSEQKRKTLWSKLMQAAGARIVDDSGKEERFSTRTQPCLHYRQKSQTFRC